MICAPDTAALTRAVQWLQAGELVAFPTETVYGLGADALNPAAVAKIFVAKGRPADHPLIVHLPSADWLDRYARNIPAQARLLAQHFWPGALTLILPRQAIVPDAVTGGQDTVGLRVPAHPLAQALLQAFGGGVAAPSANRFGRISPTTAAHVQAELGEQVSCILDGGACQVGLESTIIDLSGERPHLLRPGGISVAAIAEVLGEMPQAPTKASPRVSGQLASHYAPRTPLYLLASEQLPTFVAQYAQGMAVMALQAAPAVANVAQWVVMPNDPAAYGRLLYAQLRDLDAAGYAGIVVEQPADTVAWAAVRDRLKRAAADTQP